MSSRRSLSPLSLSPHVFSTRLAMTPVSPAAGPQVGQDGPLEHVLHLVGHAGHGVDDLVADRADQARRRAPGLRDHRRARPARAPGAGCSPASRRPRSANSSRMTSATASSGTSSTPPITAAIASRVTSSWVGPRPPVTMTASASSSSAPQRGLDAPDVVADLDLQQRPDAVQGEAIADPRRVGVVDLAEQELGADGEDVTAHGADRRTSRAVRMRSGARSTDGSARAAAQVRRSR